MISIALIGSTGSIGKQVCAVVKRYPQKFRFCALVANTNATLLAEQTAIFQPDYAVLLDGDTSKISTCEGKVKVLSGVENALKTIENCDVAFVAATGFAGLKYSLEAIRLGKKLALANKETLVCGGELVMQEVEKSGVDLIPVDSEHSAIWQALHFNRRAPFERLIITASGGPFYGYNQEQLKQVTPQSALRHPTWQMGSKITIDSATLLNKGFEVIEAKWLYDAPWEKIQTVAQSESIIHSMVGFQDGSVLAQMSYPTMEVPIQLALTYPERLPCDLKLPDFAALGTLHFKPLHRKDFPCYDLALTAGESGDNYPCALNAAGEVGVTAFLQEKISFLDIAKVIEETLSATKRCRVDGYEALLDTDLKAREVAGTIVNQCLKIS